nr:autoinducer binding domain-containing protein [Bradyrhizobium sp. CCBAU 65884]
MRLVENAFRNLSNAIQTAGDVHAFERIAERLTQKLGFRRFAYSLLDGAKPKLISSYPKSWTSRYYQPGYQQLDPVVLRARLERDP